MKCLLFCRHLVPASSPCCYLVHKQAWFCSHSGHGSHMQLPDAEERARARTDPVFTHTSSVLSDPCSISEKNKTNCRDLKCNLLLECLLDSRHCATWYIHYLIQSSQITINPKIIPVLKRKNLKFKEVK